MRQLSPKQKLRRIMAMFVAMMVVSVGAAVAASTPAYASGPAAIVGMPFTGTWAYSNPTTASCGPASSQTSHPGCHENYGGDQWSTDLYAPAGTDVRLNLTGVNGALSFSWGSPGTSSCGQATRINVYVNGTHVGRVYFTHLASAVTTGSITNGMKVGTIANLSCNPGGTGKHIHVGYQSPTSNTCYVDYSNANYTAGMTLGGGTPIGVLGSAESGTQTACNGLPTDTPSSPNLSASTGYVPSALDYNGGDVPIIGDWDANGESDFGIVSGNVWTLRYSDGHTWQAAFGNGIANGDIPMVGDWDANGYSDFGIVRGNQWILRFSDGSTWSTTFGSGITNGDIPIVGDWNHDRNTDFGVVNGNVWTIRFSNGSIWQTVFGNGIANGDIPITGDWDANGDTDFGVVNNNVWTLRYSDGSTWSATFGNGIADDDIPYVGHWDDGGRSDFGVVNGSGVWTLRFSTGSTWSTTFGSGIHAQLP